MGAGFAGGGPLMRAPAIVILSLSALPVADRLRAVTGGSVHVFAARTSAENRAEMAGIRAESAPIFFDDAPNHIRSLFI